MMSILDRLTERRSSLANPDRWLMRLLTGSATGQSAAGVEVTERSALSVTAVLACVRAVAEDVAKLPMLAYRADGERIKRKLPAHPVSGLLHRRPNPEMSAFVARRAITAGALLYGTGYAEVTRNGAGVADGIWPIEPWRVAGRRTEHGSLVWDVSPAEGAARAKTVPDENMLRLPGLSEGGVVGYMTIRLGEDAVGAALAAQRFAAAFFGNGTNLGGVLEHPGTLSDTARRHLRESIRQVHGGPSNAGKDMILEEGMKYQKLGMEPDKAQMVETRQFQVEEIARLFRVPPHKIQHLLRSTFSNIEHQSIEYVTDTLMPWLVLWEQECDHKLFLPRERGTHYTKHNVAALLRGDTPSRFDAYGKAIQAGWLSRNDVRDLEDLNPIEGGDVYLVPVNLQASTAVETTPASERQPPAPPSDPPPAPEPDAARALPAIVRAHRELLAESYGRILRIEADKRRRGKADEAFYDQHAEYVRGGIGAAVETCADTLWAVLAGEAMPEAVRQEIVAFTAGAAARHVERSRAAASIPDDRAAADAAAEIDQLTSLIQGLCARRKESTDGT